MAPMPTTVSPMLSTLVDEPPTGKGWRFEPKWDGERCVAFIGPGRPDKKVRMRNRLLHDITGRYPEIAADLGAFVRARTAVIDGEVIALDAKGRASFERLQPRFGLKDEDEIRRRMADTPVWFMAFDLLWLDGSDLRDRPLAERRRLLRTIVTRCRRSRFSKDFADARKLLAAARTLGLEGIIAKRADAPYMEGVRGRQWLKIKVTGRQECVIGGWTEGRGSRRAGFGSLILGVYERHGGKRALVPVGSVGSGFDDATIAELKARLRRLEVARSPFVRPPTVASAPHWVKPKLVAEIKFANWTSAGQLRVPVFVGLRDDKRPEDCVREVPRKS